MKRPLVVAALSAWLALRAAPVAAQTLPVPVLPSPAPAPAPAAVEEATSRAPRAADARPELVEVTATRLRPWEYALALSCGWDQNIEFLFPRGSNGLVMVPRAGLSRVFSSPHAQVRAVASTGGIGYAQRGQPRRLYADLGLDATYHSSPATEWHGGGVYGFGYSDSSAILIEQGVSLPVVKTRSLAASAGVSRRFGTRTSLRLDTRFYRIGFDSPELFDGSSFRGTFGLEHRSDARTTIGVGYSLEDIRSTRADGSYSTHFASLQWTRLLAARSGLLLETGASYTPDAERAALPQKGAFFGGASFTRQVGRSSATLFLRREAAPAFGLGVSRMDVRVGVRGAVPLGRQWDFRVDASHVRPDRVRAGGPPASSSDDASAALALRVGRRFEVTGEGRYRARGATAAAPAIRTFHVGVYLAMLSPAGGAIAATPTR